MLLLKKMKIIPSVFLLFALSAIVEGQWVAAARELYQPIILSIGAAYTFIASNKAEDDSFKWSKWMDDKLDQYGMKMEWKGKTIIDSESLNDFYDDIT